jgi:hypothetical protein
VNDAVSFLIFPHVSIGLFTIDMTERIQRNFVVSDIKGSILLWGTTN